MGHDIVPIATLFRKYAVQREGRGEGGDQGQLLAEVICAVLLSAHSELNIGTDEIGAGGDTPCCLDLLETSAAADFPEAHVCRLWLKWCDGAVDGETAGALTAVLQGPLWPPAAALAYRLLAHLGRRRTIAGLLSGKQHLTLVQADAFVEGAYDRPLNPAAIVELAPTDESIYGAALVERWRMLLLAEATLAQTGWTSDLDRKLSTIASQDTDAESGCFVPFEPRRLAGRAVAALARGRIACGQDTRDLGEMPAARFLPAWEREYLLGLAHWQTGDNEAAGDSLRAALAHNGAQSPVRLALASWMAQHDLEGALAVTDYCEPTWELLTVRAALLVRLGRFPDAQAALATCPSPSDLEGPSVGGEALRYRWLATSLRLESQQRALRRSLHEYFGNWKAAEHRGNEAADRHQRGVELARELMAAQQELSAGPRDDQWRQSMLVHRIQRNRHELSRIPLVGDALFFRAAGFVEDSPHQARDDLHRLLRQRHWVNAERRVGGGRLKAVGDILLRLGDPEAALQAYHLTGSDAALQLDERQAVALVYRDILAGAGGDELTLDADRIAGDRPWPQLMAALAFLAAGMADAASDRIQASRRSGVPERLCRVLERLCDPSDSAGKIAPEELQQLHLPAVLEAVVLLVCGPGTPEARWEAFVRVAGSRWAKLSPVDSGRATTRLLAFYCDEGRWDEALALATEFLASGDAAAPSLAAWVHARRALAGAARGRIVEADEELQTAQSFLDQAGPKDAGA